MKGFGQGDAFLSIGLATGALMLAAGDRGYSQSIDPNAAPNPWLDTDGGGRYDTLVIETRGMKGPRAFDATGIPLHEDNETIVPERIYLDKADPNLLHDDITTIDHALTRPWLVNKTYQRIVTDKSTWFGHAVCGEENAHVGIGKEVYFLSAEGLLMPAIKNQPAPDLRYLSNTTDKIAEHRSRLRACCAPARTSGFGERRNRPLPPTVRCSTDSGHIGAPPRTGASGPACVKGHVSRKSAESFSLFVFSRRQLLALFVFKSTKSRRNEAGVTR